MKERASRNKKKLTCLERMGECGICISLVPHKLNRTRLSRDEWLDTTRLGYGYKPIGLCSHCDGCIAPSQLSTGSAARRGGW